MDFQIVLLIILSLLTINLVVVGIYVIMVLKEFRVTIKKMNSVLDDAPEITDSIAGPITAISSIATGLTQGLKVLTAFKFLKKDKDSDEKDD